MRITKKIYIPLIFALSLVGAGVFLWTDEYFFAVKTTDVQVEAAPLHVSLHQEIELRAKDRLKSAALGKNIWSLSLQKIRENILTDVWIESVVIERALPQKITVRVKIKPVLFVHVDSRGKIFPITEKGQLLNPVSLAQTPDVPVIRSSTVVKSADILSKIIELYKMIPSEGALTQKDIAEIDWSSVNGMKVELVRSEDGEVILGLSDVRTKAKRVANVLKYLESQKQKWRVIDASFSKKVLVRLRKHS